MEPDFEPHTKPESSEEYRLLILDRHNSHCTYPFIKFSAEHCIIIICLPSHTTHALQSCNVGVFGPLACTWKSQVTQASQKNIPITKSNLLQYYHEAQSIALKPTTIQSAFRKMGIYPLDHNAVLLSAFEPAKNTTTQAVQPLPATLPSLFIPTPVPSPAVSAAPAGPSSHVSVSASASIDDAGAPVDHDGANPRAPESRSADPIASTAYDKVRTEPEPRQQYHIDVPPPLPHSASCRALQEENKMLQDILEQAGVVLEQDYA